MSDKTIEPVAPAKKPEELPPVHHPYPWMQGKEAFLACSPRQLPRGLRRAHAIHTRKARAEKGGK